MHIAIITTRNRKNTQTYLYKGKQIPLNSIVNKYKTILSWMARPESSTRECHRSEMDTKRTPHIKDKQVEILIKKRKEQKGIGDMRAKDGGNE